MRESLFRCPVCGAPLVRETRAYRCGNRHSYDIAREGYTYLLSPIRSTPLRRAMTRRWQRPGGSFFPKGIIVRFSIRSVVKFSLLPAIPR